MDPEEKKKYIQECLKKGILVSPELLENLEKPDFDTDKILVADQNTSQLLKSNSINFEELEKMKAKSQQINNSDNYNEIVNNIGNKEEEKIEEKDDSIVKIVANYTTKPQKRTIQDAIMYFNTRFRLVEGILKQRRDLQSTISLGRLKNKNDPEEVAVVGMVLDKRETKNKNLAISLEDSTGTITAIINQNKMDLFNEGSDLVPDEVVGMTGTAKNGFLFVNNIYLPDVPLHKELKKSPNEGYCAFLSDIHVGSKQFLKEDFERFLEWVNGKIGNDVNKEIAKKLKYIIITGDVVDGVGVYIDQNEELTIEDVGEQYNQLAEYLKQIPSHIKIIISPGNHDAVQISEPQPPLGSGYSQALSKIPNVINVSNPGIVNIDSTEDFPGFDIVLYHGYSFDYYIAEVDSIRQNGGYDRPDLIMKFLLRRRHLGPTHTSTLHMHLKDNDPLFLKEVPDILAVGHVHRTGVSTYRNVTMICGSCWQGMTPFQERMGHNPQPSRVPVMNLQTREMKILRFGK